MTPSTKLVIAADRLANRPCSDTERATANLLKLISDRLHERGFYPEPELKAALALADAVEREHGMPETPRSLAADNHVVELLALAIRRRERTPEAIAADEAERGYHNAIIGYREMVRDMLRGIDKAVAEVPAAIARRDELFRSGEYVVPDWFAKREASATQPLPDRAEADQYLPADLKPVAVLDEQKPVEHAEQLVAFERGMGWRGTCQCGFRTAGYVKEFDARRTLQAHITLSEAEVMPKVLHGLGSANWGGDGLYRRCLCGEAFFGRDFNDVDAKIAAHIEKAAE